jgi:3'(2'), 5'-bisphosphate nucleotidase
MTTYEQYLAASCIIAKEAGKLIMGYFNDGFAHSKKADDSPVTEADIAANKYITEHLQKLAPEIPIIAEEDEEQGSHLHDRFFLVDPLDGTRSFVRGEPEFTVNIGLVENGKPVFGVIYHPPLGALYYGMVGRGAYKQIGEGATQKIHTRPRPQDGYTIVRSRSHPSKKTQAYLQTINVKEIIGLSSSVKLCLIAEGTADIYPRFGRTMEWDIAAGHAILEAAGGRVETAEGAKLTYGKQGFENPHIIGGELLGTNRATGV